MAARTAVKRIGSVLAWGAAGVLVAGLAAWTRHLLSLDPFARFRAVPGPAEASVAIRMDDVELAFFEGADQVGGAKVERLDIRRDRQATDLFYLRDGFYQGRAGRYRFEATRAAYNNVTGRLSVPSGAKIRGDDMDLVVAAFEADTRSGRLHVPGIVRGELFGGAVEAASLTYSPEDGSFKIGPATWVGLAALSLSDEPKQQKKSKWTFKTSGATRSATGLEVWLDAEATDGEVIVKAPRIERDTKTDVITATGGVRYFSKKANLTCEKAVVYRKEKRAVLTGKVQMVLKPEDRQELKEEEIPPFQPEVPEEIAKNRPPAPPGEDKKADDEVRSTKSARKYPVVVLADRIEYWYAEGERRAVIEGKPQARQGLAAGRWRYGWCDRAYYDGEKETLRLVSSPGKKDTRIKTSLGDDLAADWFEFSTRENDDQWSAQGLQGDVYAEEDEVPTPPGQKKEGASGGKAGETKPPLTGPIGSDRR